MSLQDPAVAAAVHARWRLRLLVAAVLLGLGVAVSFAIALAYDESLVVPLLLGAGVGCLVLARRAVPASLRASAAWTVLAIMLYVLLPVALSSMGVLAG